MKCKFEVKRIKILKVLSKQFCTDRVTLFQFNFGLRSRIKNISKIKQSNLSSTSSGP